MALEQSTVAGNIIVIFEILKNLKISDEDIEKTLILFAGDLLTINRIRSIIAIRSLYMRVPLAARVLNKMQSFLWAVPLKGFFHLKMCDASAIFGGHWGTPNSADEPASLW